MLGWQVTADTRLSLFSSPGCSVAPGFYLRARYVSLGPRTRARCLSQCGSCPAQRERREHHDREHFPFDTFTSREYWREKIAPKKAQFWPALFHFQSRNSIILCWVTFTYPTSSRLKDTKRNKKSHRVSDTQLFHLVYWLRRKTT